MSTGPTSLTALLTSEIIADVQSEGFSPQSIASAVAMSVGIYSLAIGLFKLGFLLEFVSIPVLSGFISATGIVIMLGQIPSLFGVKVGTGTAHIIHDLFAQIPKFKPPTIGIGFGSIFLLVVLQKISQKWGKKSKAIWLIGLARSAIVLVLFTGISYAVNKNREDDPVWELSRVKSDGIDPPTMPPTALIQEVFPRSVAPFLAASIEHLAIAKGFGRKNGYVIDPAQELVYLGATNFFNSFFSAQPVGGAMSRTAVNSDTGVKSPAYGFVAGGFVILSIYKLSPALFWLPKATLAAIIVTAVWHIISPPKVFYAFWKTSLVDFVASMLSFWITLFVSTEIGIGSAVGFSLVYHILYTAFQRVKRVDNLETYNPFNPEKITKTPDDSQVFKLTQSMIFYNAFHVKGACFDVVQTYNSGSTVSYQVKNAVDRSWSVSGERRVRNLRKKAGIVDEPLPIQTVVLDFSMVTTIDTTGLTALQDLKADLKTFGGEYAELRFVSVKKSLRERFDRFGWPLYNAEDIHVQNRRDEKGSPVYKSVVEAVSERIQRVTSEESGPSEMMVVGDEKV